MKWQGSRQSDNVLFGEKAEHPVLGTLFNLRAAESGQIVEIIPESVNSVCVAASLSRLFQEGAITLAKHGPSLPAMDSGVSEQEMRQKIESDGQAFAARCADLTKAFHEYSHEFGLVGQTHESSTPAEAHQLFDAVPQTHPQLIARPADNNAAPRR